MLFHNIISKCFSYIHTSERRAKIALNGVIKNKRLILGSSVFMGLIGFFYFYDFNKNGHDLMIKNRTNSAINIIKVTNNDQLVSLSKAWLVPSYAFTSSKKQIFFIPAYSQDSKAFMGIASDLSVGVEKPTVLKVTVQEQSGEIKTASCYLIRHKNQSSCIFIVGYVGDQTMPCACDDISMY